MPRTGLSGTEVRSRAVELAIRKIREEGLEHIRLIDIAKDIGVSHVALYSYFADKSALVDAVSEQWLSDLDKSLEQICLSPEPVCNKIRSYFVMLHRTKRDRVSLEPELYKAFNLSSTHMKPFVLRHLQSIENQVLRLTHEAAEQNLLTMVTPEEAKDILLEATYRFTEPQLVQQLHAEDREPLLNTMITALLNGFAVTKTRVAT
jgi:AcrR family transcriptional regulator